MNTGICSRILASNRQVVSVPTTPVAADFTEALDIEGMFLPEFTLNLKLTVNNLPDATDLGFSEAIRLSHRVNTSPRQKAPAQTRADSVDVLQ